jgi:hypothetical protein
LWPSLLRSEGRDERIGLLICKLAFLFLRKDTELRSASNVENPPLAECWWLKPVILADWEVEVRRILVRGKPGQLVFETPSPE